MQTVQETYKETKIGIIPKDWDLVSFLDLGSFFRGHTYSSINIKSTGLIVLRSTNIQNNNIILNKDLVFVDKICKSEILLKKDDIIICMANGSKRLVGKSAKYLGEDREDVTIGAFCSLFRTTNELAHYSFQSFQYKKYLQITLSGSTINNLKNSDLEKFIFPFPKNTIEQNKYTEILSTVDEQISLTDKIIEKSKELKQV